MIPQYPILGPYNLFFLQLKLQQGYFTLTWVNSLQYEHIHYSKVQYANLIAVLYSNNWIILCPENKNYWLTLVFEPVSKKVRHRGEPAAQPTALNGPDWKSPLKLSLSNNKRKEIIKVILSYLFVFILFDWIGIIDYHFSNNNYKNSHINNLI